MTYNDFQPWRGPRLPRRRSLFGRSNRGLFGIAFALILILGIGIPACGSYTERHTTTTVVNSKERVCSDSTDGNSDCKYLVFTDAGTFSVEDSVILFRWNSSDVYGKIKEGHRYKITSYGWRFGCTSSYPNIEKVEEVPA